VEGVEKGVVGGGAAAADEAGAAHAGESCRLIFENSVSRRFLMKRAGGLVFALW